MSDFLNKDYKIPAGSSGYFKFLEGENTFRVMSSAIIGWEYWSKDNKPVRQKEKWDEIPADIKVDDEGRIQIKHFWSFIIWDYKDSKIKIMTITQQGIMKDIKALIDNKKWGSPLNFDITITRTGKDFTTKYSVMPNPASELDDKAKEAFEDKPINLDALYLGLDPFSTETKPVDLPDAKKDDDEVPPPSEIGF